MTTVRWYQPRAAQALHVPLAFAQAGMVCFSCRDLPENNFVVFGAECIDTLTRKSPAVQQKGISQSQMLRPFNRRKMAPAQDVAMPVPCACGCLVLHEVLPKGSFLWCFLPSPHPSALPCGKCFQGSAPSRDGARPRRLCPEAGLCWEG